MLLYLMLLLLIMASIFLGNTKNLYSRMYYALVYFLILALSSFRSSSIGNDTYKYVSLFNLIKHTSLKNLLAMNDRYEIGYLLLNKLVALISDREQAIIIVTSLIIFGGLYYFLKSNSINPSLSLFFLITFGFFAFFNSGIRESIAIIICLNSVSFIKTRKVVPFLFCIALAVLFHVTSIIFLPAYFLYNIDFTNKVLVFVLSLGVAFIFVFDKILNLFLKYFPRYSTYLTTAYNDRNIRLATVLNIIVVLIVFIIARYYDKKDQVKNVAFTNFLFIGFVILFSSLVFNLLDRVANYYTIFLIVTAPNSILRKMTASRILLAVSMVLSFLIYFIVVQIFRPEWNSIFPYQFFWNA